jgi:ATP-dependent Lon protease
MTIPSKHRFQVLVSDSDRSFPVLPLQTGVLFPGMLLTIQVGKPENLQLIEDCKEGPRDFVASYSPHLEDESGQPAIHQIGVFAHVAGIRPGPGNSLLVTIEGLERAALSEIDSSGPYQSAVAQYLLTPADSDGKVTALMNKVITTVEEITKLDPTYSPEQLNILEMNKSNPSILADQLATTFHFSLADRQELLEATDLVVRFKLLLGFLNTALQQLATLRSINLNVQKSLEDEQENQFLRQQLREIRRRLGEDFEEEKEAARYRNLIKETKSLTPEAEARAMIEADRLSQISTASAEYGVTKNYLDWVLALPWSKCTPENYEIRDVEKTLSANYFGPTSIKEQILQRLSVRKLLGGINEGPTLCLVGAAGTGKASLAKAIAGALDKQFVRISVGGIADVSELKGMLRTFLGAMPGKVLRTIRDAGVCDPVILIEDIDYFNIDNDSSVNMALLDAIDTRRNNRFLDNYLGVPFDLSRVFFICSVRSYEEIPEQFLPRFEIIELPGYIEKEKIVISKRYIIPSLLKKHGILKSELRFASKALSTIVNGYTQEAGLLQFAQQIEKICRKVALEKTERKATTWRVTEKNLERYLGQPIFIPEKAETEPEIGVATGLAWTGSGGELMFIEALKMKGEGGIITTGSLGEVMRESIQAAHSYVRSKADILAIDFNDFNEFDIHIHFPSGAIPKDGPSAGVAVCLAIASVMSERSIRNDIAMTGEVTLRGRVLPVGGIREKISAAYRAGLTQVALPKENQKDLRDLPKEILRKTKFVFIERVDELFEECLMDFTPSAFTLEKIFAKEIASAKKKRKSTTKRSRKKAAKSR